MKYERNTNRKWKMMAMNDLKMIIISNTTSLLHEVEWFPPLKLL